MNTFFLISLIGLSVGSTVINSIDEAYRDWGAASAAWGSCSSRTVVFPGCFLLVTFAFPQDARDRPDLRSPRTGESQVMRGGVVISSSTSSCLSITLQTRPSSFCLGLYMACESVWETWAQYISIHVACFCTFSLTPYRADHVGMLYLHSRLGAERFELLCKVQATF